MSYSIILSLNGLRQKSSLINELKTFVYRSIYYRFSFKENILTINNILKTVKQIISTDNSYQYQHIFEAEYRQFDMQPKLNGYIKAYE